MTAKEKRLLTWMLVLFLGYVVPFMLLPKAIHAYHDYWDDLDRLHLDIERYQRLSQETENWQQANDKAKAEAKTINDSLLKGSNRDLIAARLQSILRNIAQQQSITLRSMAVPEFSTNDRWMIISQTIEFDIDSQVLPDLISKLNRNPERLIVISLEARSASVPTRLSVQLKVAGFSRVLDNSTPPSPTAAS